MPGRRRNPARGRIDLHNPLTDHDLNVGRVGWWLVMPQWLGGSQWFDLVQSQTGSFAGFSSGFGWNPLSSPGGSGSVKFNGTATKVTAGNPPALQLGSVGTVSGWIYLAASKSFHMLASKENFSTDRNGYSLSISSSKIYLELANGSTYNFTTGTTALALNTWYHIAGVWNGTSLFTYLNGVQDSTSAQNLNPVSNVNGFTIGADTVYTGAFLNGYLNSVSVWGRPLTAVEIALDYTLSKQGYPGVLNRVSTASWSAPASSSITFNASVATATWTAQTATFSGTLTEAPATQTATWNAPAATFSGALTESPASQTGTWNAPAPTFTGSGNSQTFNASVAVATWGAPAATFSGSGTLAPSAAGAAWSAPGPAFSGALTESPAAANAAWATPAPSFRTTWTPAAVTATWSAPAAGFAISSGFTAGNKLVFKAKDPGRHFKAKDPGRHFKGKSP